MGWVTLKLIMKSKIKTEKKEFKVKNRPCMTLCEPDTALQEPDGGPGGVRGVGATLPLVVHRQNLHKGHDSSTLS